MTRLFWFALGFLGVLGCVDVNGQLVPSILHAGPSASPTGPASASVVATPITSTVPEQAADIRTRAQAVVGKANAAVKLDGSEEAQIVFNHVVSACSWRVDMCQDPFATPEARTSLVGALAARAVLQAQLVTKPPPDPWGQNPPLAPRIAEGERFAERALTEAKRVAEEHKQQQADMAAEGPKLEAATATCNANVGQCKTRCDKGDQLYCLVYAWDHLRTAVPPKLDDAWRLIVAACDANVTTSCLYMRKINADIQAYNATMDQEWQDVQKAVDEIAQRMYRVYFGRTVLKPAQRTAYQKLQTDRGIQQITAYMGMLVQQRYCPAKKAFVARYGASEFAARAAYHCKTDAPVADYTHEILPVVVEHEVKLTSQCQEAYATACP